jgi:hypothetical protein
MKITFFYVMEWFQIICMILSLLFSLPLINNDRVKSYMKKFYWYSIVAAILAVLRFSSDRLSPSAQEFITKVNIYSILFHFTFLSIFISSVLPNKKGFSKYSPAFISAVFCITLIFLLFDQNVRGNSVSFAIANLGLVIYCIVYYYNSFKEPSNADLLQEPSFWIISGIFLCMSASIPINSLHEFLRNETQIDIQRRKDIFGISYFAYGIFHLFLIKAYLCSTSHQTV